MAKQRSDFTARVCVAQVWFNGTLLSLTKKPLVQTLQPFGDGDN